MRMYICCACNDAAVVCGPFAHLSRSFVRGVREQFVQAHAFANDILHVAAAASAVLESSCCVSLSINDRAFVSHSL